MSMKRIFHTLLFSATALSFAGCNKDALSKLTDITFTQPYSFNVTFPEGATVDTSATPVPIPGGTAALPPFSFTFPTEMRKIAEDYNTSLDKLVAVKLSSFTLSPLAPAGQNLNFMNSVELRISAPGMSEVVVAKKSPFPKDAASISLDVVDANLKEYFIKDSVTVTVAADVNAIPPAGTEIQLDSKYKITANPLK